jgi:hypothetical protein
MSEKLYKVTSYDFVRGWEKDAVTKTDLTRDKLMKHLGKILDGKGAPKITIELWRDG